MKKTLTTIAYAAVTLLAACATPGPAPQELVQARTAVHQAELDPGVLANAALELKRATDSLQRANALFAKGESLADISSAAYVAQTQARTAMAMADAKRNEEAITAAQTDRERARADAKDMEARRARSQAATAQAQATDARIQASVARGQAQDAEQRAEVAQAVAAGAQAQSAMLRQRLQELQAQETDRGMLVTLGDVLFEFNRADVKPGAQVSMRKLADFLQQYPDRLVLIEGHTDSVGSAASNTTLSERRAEAVAASLAELGVARARIKTVGYGKDYPIADNSTDTNRALNRRVEVYISPSAQAVRMRR